MLELGTKAPAFELPDQNGIPLGSYYDSEEAKSHRHFAKTYYIPKKNTTMCIWQKS